MLTNKENRFLNHGCVNTHLSNGHLFVYSILKQTSPRLPSKIISYRSYKNLVEDDLLMDPENYLSR